MPPAAQRVMNEYERFKQKIQAQAETLQDAVQRLEDNRLIDGAKAGRWKAQLRLAVGSMETPLVRIAVVGSVKSGKSTLINAVLGTDLLKRGAGIITSFITRIRSAEQPGGWVALKSWAQVNAEVNDAVRLLPVFGDSLDETPAVDLRRAKDRERLRGWLETVQRDWQQARGRLDPNFILLNAYLEGYPKLRDTVAETSRRLDLDPRQLKAHQRFVGEESQAAYLEDMELHHPMAWLSGEIEIADCQGSDSPNPLHLALLQQYLLQSHFILYVISSRTGLREADLKLLEVIKTLRMLPQTFFVLNLDLDSHSGMEDLEASIERVHRELGWTVPSPNLFAFSGLFQLVAALGEEADERESRRLELWRKDAAAAARHEKGFLQLKEELTERIDRQRTRVLVNAGLGRLAMTAHSISDTARTQKVFFGERLDHLQQSARHLENRQKALMATLGTLENAVTGLRETLKQDMDGAVSRFFDLDRGPVVQETLKTVEHYPIDPDYLQELNDPRRLVRQLHRFYLEFRRDLSRYLVEKVNLRAIAFGKEQEDALRENLERSSRAFWALFQTAMEEYRAELARHHVDLLPMDQGPSSEWIQWEPLAPPPFSGFVEENAVGRSVLLVKFGLGRLTRFLSQVKGRLGRKDPDSSAAGPPQSLQEAIDLVKSETASELIYAFKDYRQNFRFMYLHRMADSAASRLLEAFRSRAEAAHVNFEDLVKRGADAEDRRREDMSILDEIGTRAEELLEEWEALCCAISLEWLPRGGAESVPEAERSRPSPPP